LRDQQTPPVLRRARVLAVSADLAEIELLEGPLLGKRVPGVFYRELGDPPVEGDEVSANTVGLEMKLGTGSVAVILPRAAAEVVPANANHFVKLPYTPLQFPALAAPQAETLDGVPIVVLPLHSHLAPSCCAAGALRPGCSVAFVWQEGGALPVALSNAVQELKGKGLLRTVVSCGNCFGGDLEAVNVYSGLLAAAEVADLVLVGIGPGILGTGTPEGHAGWLPRSRRTRPFLLGASLFLRPVSPGLTREGGTEDYLTIPGPPWRRYLGAVGWLSPLAILPGSSTGRSRCATPACRCPTGRVDWMHASG